MHCTALKSPLRTVCVHTNFHTKCSSYKDRQSHLEVDGQSTPLLEKFTNFFCVNSVTALCQSDVFVFLIPTSLLCNYDVLWLFPPCRRA